MTLRELNLGVGLRAPLSRSIVAAGLIVAGALHLVQITRLLSPPSVDYPMFHQTARALATGAREAYPATSNALTREPGYNLNAPHFHVFVAPLAGLPMPEARDWFRVTNIAGIILAAAVVRVAWRPGWVVAALWCAGTSLLILLGQVGGLLAPFAAWGIRASTLGRWDQAGIAVGSLIALKPIFWPLGIWLVAERQWRGVASSGLAIAAWFGAGLVVAGVAPYLEWFNALGRVSWSANTFNASWMGVTHRVLNGPWEMAARVGGWSLVVAFTLRHLWSAPLLMRYLGALVTALLLSPLGWIHYLVVLTGPLVMWLERGHRWPWMAWCLWVPFFVTDSVQGSQGLTQFLLGSTYWWGALSLWWAVIRSR